MCSCLVIPAKDRNQKVSFLPKGLTGGMPYPCRPRVSGDLLAAAPVSPLGGLCGGGLVTVLCLHWWGRSYLPGCSSECFLTPEIRTGCFDRTSPLCFGPCGSSGIVWPAFLSW